MIATELEYSSAFSWHWSPTDKASDAELHNGNTRILFHSADSRRCAGVRGIMPFANKMEHYFEVEMYPPFHGRARMVGIGTSFTHLESADLDFNPIIGRDQYSYGINYTGRVHHRGQEAEYASDLDTNALDKLTIAVLFDTLSHCLSFHINGRSYSVAFKGIDPSVEFFPMACATARNSAIQLTTCRSSVATLKNLCRKALRDHLQQDTSRLQRLPLPPKLVAYLQFLSYREPSARQPQGIQTEV